MTRHSIASDYLLLAVIFWPVLPKRQTLLSRIILSSASMGRADSIDHLCISRLAMIVRLYRSTPFFPTGEWGLVSSLGVSFPRSIVSLLPELSRLLWPTVQLCSEKQDESTLSNWTRLTTWTGSDGPEQLNSPGPVGRDSVNRVFDRVWVEILTTPEWAPLTVVSSY